jgi:hypothetical protein
MSDKPDKNLDVFPREVMEAAIERFMGNIKHPLVKKAANHQVHTRTERGRLHAEISTAIRQIGELKCQDEILVYLIGQCSEPEESRRKAALDELKRLFEGAPDGRQPAQKPFQRKPDEEDSDEPEPETEAN